MQALVIKGKYKGNVMEVVSHSNEVFTLQGGRRFKASHLAFTLHDAEELAREGGALKTEYRIRVGLFKPPYTHTFVQASTVNRGNRISIV